MSKYYIGKFYGVTSYGFICGEVFKSDTEPTAANYPQYAYVIGPFKHKHTAVFMLERPMIQHVSDAVRIEKRLSK